MKRFLILLVTGLTAMTDLHGAAAGTARPNILFAIADDWGWPHAGVYGDPVVKTPTFDRVAKEGVLFQHAFISSPSCTPSRNAILTGQQFWRLGTGANLWSTLDTKFKTYPLLLQEAGYFVGHWRKSWGPGRLTGWENDHPAGKAFKGVDDFLKQWPRDKPFCFWFGASDPHRPYKEGSGKESGMDLSKIKLFEHYPDSEEIRGDVADYYWEVQRFDRELGEALEKLEALGVLDNTLVVVTGDHGMPFPRCKSNLYDSGARVPLAIRWPEVIKAGRVLEDFVSTTDLAPTFFEAAGTKMPEGVTGRSLMNVLRSPVSGRIEPFRDRVVMGKERHVVAQEAPDRGGTPMRAIRTFDYLFIQNFRPDRWPSGTPHHEKATIPGAWLADCDNGPTKTYMVVNQGKDEEHRLKYDLAFAKRPEFELYDLTKDPDQLHNVAYETDYIEARGRLQRRLTDQLKATDDPRIFGRGDETFDPPPYFGTGPRYPGLKK